MPAAHLYIAAPQPATAWIDNCGEREIRGVFPPTARINTECCGKKRLAAECVVRCFYDGLSIWCADGCGCKNPQEIERKRLLAYENRSHAQQARRMREQIIKENEK